MKGRDRLEHVPKMVLVVVVLGGVHHEHYSHYFFIIAIDFLVMFDRLFYLKYLLKYVIL
jgi:general stress protein CsbA